MTSMEVTVVGGSGYAGGELLRILLGHSEIRIKQVTSSQWAGHPVSLLHPNLRGLTSLSFSKPDDLKPCDVIFLALPNGESQKSIENWMRLAEKIIDLGADFRLKKNEDWKFWYGTEHAQPHLLPKFVYGLPELYRDKITGARYVAGPGCEAIVSILCLYPFLKHQLIKNNQIIIDAKMGSSQAGNKATPSSHHPERAGAVRSYKTTGHRHAAEIEQVLSDFCPDTRVDISATAVEMVRGILVTIHTFLEKDVSEKDIWKILSGEYSEKPFVRIIKQQLGLYRLPEPKILQGTNYCEIGFEKEKRGNRLVIIGAIDNLVKGTAGNAVQCLNLMSGFPESTGLEFPGLHPI